MFQRRGHLVLKGATILGKNICSLIFPFRVTPLSLKCIRLKKKDAKIKLRQYVSLLKSPNFDATDIKCFTVNRGSYRSAH